MGKTVLPKTLIEEITRLQNQGYSSVEIFDLVNEEAQKSVVSGAQLSRCIAAIGRRDPTKPSKAKTLQSKGLVGVPSPKTFDASKFKDLIESLNEEMDEKLFESQCQVIAMDILSNCEGFRGLKDANTESNFPNPPFDFFGFKNGVPYVIEFKGSLNHFNSPGETQKRRLQELRKEINGLNVALLQVKLRSRKREGKGEYRIFYNEEMDLLFNGKTIPLKPLISWIRKQLN